MATKKSAVPADEKLERQDFNLFEALAALDKKDYDYLDKLTDEQVKKFSPYMMLHWMSAVKANGGIQGYYVRSVDYYANTHFFSVQHHPKLQWQMLCASSPSLGKQFHQWIPHLSSKVSTLKEVPKAKDIKEYYSKIYPDVDNGTLTEISETFVHEHEKKVYLAKLYPNLKQSDIELLAQMVTDEDIKQYERDRGN